MIELPDRGGGRAEHRPPEPKGQISKLRQATRKACPPAAVNLLVVAVGPGDKRSADWAALVHLERDLRAAEGDAGRENYAVGHHAADRELAEA